jgi:hypothetical protein
MRGDELEENMSRPALCSGILAATWLIGVLPGYGSPINLPNAVASVYAGAQSRSDFGQVGACGATCGGASLDGPEVYAYGVDAGARSGAGVHEYFEIVGPHSVSIPIVIQGHYALSESGSGGIVNVGLALGLFNFNDSSYLYPPTLSCNLSGPPFGPPCNVDTSYSVHLDAGTGLLYDLYIVASGAIFSGGTGAYSAIIDPTITIDPSFSGASNYSIISSPNIGQTAVPEPATMTMLGTGLLALARRWSRANRPRCSATSLNA